MTDDEVRWWNNRAEQCRQINYVIRKIWGYLADHRGATNLQIAEGLGLDRSHAAELGRIRRKYVAGSERAATAIERYREEHPQATAWEIARDLKYARSAVEHILRSYLRVPQTARPNAGAVLANCWYCGSNEFRHSRYFDGRRGGGERVLIWCEGCDIPFSSQSASDWDAWRAGRAAPPIARALATSLPEFWEKRGDFEMATMIREDGERARRKFHPLEEPEEKRPRDPKLEKFLRSLHEGN